MKSYIQKILENEGTCLKDEILTALRNVAICHSLYVNSANTERLAEMINDEDLASQIESLISLCESFLALGILFFAHGLTDPNEFQTPRN